ncbi:MAG: DUF262 domain-containing HNH endonuclease family protein [Cyclobacteriaceae bacterium]|jgi:uncharacterized protein with ParB-like and HNH nuclease domain|nr:DUF262 domain-containing HNH endonuclease family protein [Cyclobacteriaceae bacterium]
MDIKAEVKSISELKDYFFIVPDYQREYVWTADGHVQQFLQDIYNEFDPAKSFKDQSKYFIGSSIIVKRNDSSFDVVDGQQRLTTIVISLCAIRETLESLEGADEDIKSQLLKIINDWLYVYNIALDKKTPRLILQYPESKTFLTSLIEKKEFTEQATPSIKKMRDALNAVKQFLKEIEQTDKSILLNFIKYFLINVELVVIKPDDLSSALKIFETINQRGAGLNAMDLVKNLLFSHASEDDFSAIKVIWKEMSNELDQSGEGDNPLRFLRYFITARYHDGVLREDQLYNWIISKEGKQRIGYQNDPLAFAKELKKGATLYSRYIKATNSWEEDSDFSSITGIGYLLKKNSRQHLIPLLALKDSFAKSDAALLSQNLEALAFYYSVNRILTKSYETLFASWATQLRGLKNTEELKTFIKEKIAPEIEQRQEQFLSSFPNRSQYDLNPQYRVKYILGKVEDFIRQKSNLPRADFAYYQDQQLEHILPQTGENIPTDKYPQKYDYENAVYKFGNLTLLEAPINQSINFYNDVSNNEWFEGKKEAYQNSDIFLTRTLSSVSIGQNTAFNQFAKENLKSHDEWGIESISARQEMMKKLMMEIWKPVF